MPTLPADRRRRFTWELGDVVPAPELTPAELLELAGKMIDKSDDEEEWP